MAKTAGGNRTMSEAAFLEGVNPVRIAESRREFDTFMATGNYDAARSVFYKKGGYYLVHKDRNDPNHEGDSPDFSDVAAKRLAKYGFRVRFEKENAYISRDRAHRVDGHVEGELHEFKTLNTAGTQAMERMLKKAAKQFDSDREMKVVYYIRDPKANAAYINGQLDNLRKHGKHGEYNRLKRLTIIWATGGLKVNWKK